MPRPKAHTHDDLISKSMMHFWRHGYDATSMDDLVRATGVSRHGIYAEASGKEGLFLACLNNYSETVVTPAFSVVEQSGADLSAVAAFFDYQIAAGERARLTSLGCLMANTMTEVAPRDPAVAKIVSGHNERLRSGFRVALENTTLQFPATRAPLALDNLAVALVVFANGLWSLGRSNATPTDMRGAAYEMIRSLHGRLKNEQE
jgi:TetR/AcrR family transcriptional regulator, transcriptional repressor for nem operon